MDGCRNNATHSELPHKTQVSGVATGEPSHYPVNSGQCSLHSRPTNYGEERYLLPPSGLGQVAETKCLIFYSVGFLLHKNIQILKTNVLTARGTNTSIFLYTENPYWCISHHNHNHQHQGLGHLARSVSRVTAALANVSSVSQLFSFLVDCSGMILKGFGYVAFFAGVKASSFCICNIHKKYKKPTITSNTLLWICLLNGY
jgi:hypothetical protein